MQIQQAAKAGNWDLITAKERSRKENWDLGIQKLAFLGLADNANVIGLLNQSSVTVDTATITQPISTMSPPDLKQFCFTVLNVYRSNAQRTAWPDRFVIPESDFLGLGAQASADFPIKSTLAVLEETFAVLTGNKGFKILPLAYADAQYGNPGETNQIYTLYRSNEDDMRLNIPVDYTNTLANSVDNFSFQNVAYGQFTGIQLYRPLTQIYFKFPAVNANLPIAPAA